MGELQSGSEQMSISEEDLPRQQQFDTLSPQITDNVISWETSSLKSYHSQSSDPSTEHGSRYMSAGGSARSMSSISLKSDMSQFCQRLEKAVPLIHDERKENVELCLNMIQQMIIEAWTSSTQMVLMLCDHIQKSGILDVIYRLFVTDQHNLRLESGKVLDAFLSTENVSYLVEHGYLKEFILTIIRQCSNTDTSLTNLALSYFETLFRQGPEIGREIVENGGLDYVVEACKIQTNPEALQHAAVALSNLAVFGNAELHQHMIRKEVHAWLFVLANHDDERIKYYACLTVGILGSSKANERVIRDTGILPLIHSFVRYRKPEDVAKLDIKHGSGRTKQWLKALAPLLYSPLSEIVALALFQFVMEASVRKGSDRIKVFEELQLIPKLQDIASCPPAPIAGEYADQLLAAIGEPIPYKLTQSVPFWTIKDVHYWVCKRSADYSCVDPSRLDMWLTRLDPELSVYTYEMLLKGLDRNSLMHIDDEILSEVCNVDNSVYRRKILNAVKDVKHIADADLAILRKQVDIFISYRRSNGSQLASLLKVHLQLKGYKVFLDIDRLFAGQFDKSLLDNIRAAKHFILILTRNSLDPCIGDVDCRDWVHLEIKVALESGSNIVPVLENGFNWPPVQSLPEDIQEVCTFNGIQWVHEYQEACVDKLYRFLNDRQLHKPSEGTSDALLNNDDGMMA